jgi:hypothetical protein
MASVPSGSTSVQPIIDRPQYPCRVQQLAKGPQLRVDAGKVSLAVPVNVLPLTLTNWMDHCPVLLSLSRWGQERASQPKKIELVTLYKNEYK